jgi:hypothetical protein
MFGTPMLRPVLGKEFERTSIPAKETELEVKIYPNPTKDKLFIELPLEKRQENMIVSIYSITGQKIYERPYTPELSLSNYTNGVYILQLTDKDNRSTVRKFLISK